MGALNKFLDAKARHYESLDAIKLAESDYFALGAVVGEVLNGANFGFLVPYSDMTEACIHGAHSSLFSFTYNLKLRNDLSRDDVVALKTYLRRNLANKYGLDIRTFNENYRISVVGATVVISKKLRSSKGASATSGA